MDGLEMPEEDLNAQWYEIINNMASLKNQIEELKEKYEQLSENQVQITDELIRNNYKFNFDTQTWIKRDPETIKQYKVYINGEFKGTIKVSSDTKYVNIPPEWIPTEKMTDVTVELK